MTFQFKISTVNYSSSVLVLFNYFLWLREFHYNFQYRLRQEYIKMQNDYKLALTTTKWL